MHNNVNNQSGLTLFGQGYARPETKSYKPICYDMSKESDVQTLKDLIKDRPELEVHDSIRGQLCELIKAQNPKLKLSQTELIRRADFFFKDIDSDYYGVWVYYPWSQRLVHLLPEKDFIFVRTCRNWYKITPEEASLLSQKKIGVVGLSVGQSVAVAMAMERSFGEIRIADFDVLELSNLNRIRTGVHTLDLLKAYAVAREIAEIDPFLKVTVFESGLTEDNMHDFFTKFGKLDLIIDECDGLDIKVLLRHKAKSLGVPVVMEASDKCMVDVERFDLEPQRPILHGIIDHLDPNLLKTLKTNEQKMPYLLDMLGIETCSNRLKASMLEIEQTITTWPQLASAVIMGGGITADVVRRIMLDSYQESGRYFVDVEELIGNKKNVQKPLNLPSPPIPSDITTAIVLNEVGKLNLSVPVNAISKNEVNLLMIDAVKAPSAGNAQHWKWFSDGQRLFLFHDKSKSYGWTDANYFAANLGLGTAIQSVVLSAQKNQLPLKFVSTIQQDTYLVGYFEKSADHMHQIFVLNNGKPLYDGIGIRHTNRKFGNKAVVPQIIVDELQQVVGNACKKHVLSVQTDQKVIDELADILGEVETLRFLDPRGHAEFFDKELRWNEQQVKATKDGLDLETLELGFVEQVGVNVSKNPDVVALLNAWGLGAGFKKISTKATQTASLIGLVTTAQIDDTELLRLGQTVMDLWTACNMMGYAMHPISAPLFFTHRLARTPHYFTPSQEEKIQHIQSRLNNAWPILKQQKGAFMFRLHKADNPTAIALRKEIKDILIQYDEI